MVMPVLATLTPVLEELIALVDIFAVPSEPYIELSSRRFALLGTGFNLRRDFLISRPAKAWLAVVLSLLPVGLTVFAPLERAPQPAGFIALRFGLD
jgi:hypothetical protein